MELFLGSGGSNTRLSIDWKFVLATTAIAALVIGTVVRTGPERLPGMPGVAGGLHVLAANQRLVSFEDFSFGADGWTMARQPVVSHAAASVLGPFGGGTIAKTFALPVGTARVALSFDLHLIGGWSGEGLSIALNGDPIVQDVAGVWPQEAALQRRPNGEHSVWIALDTPGETLDLVIQAPASSRALWSIDNVSLVASTAAF